MERTKRISSQTLAIAILTVLLVASLLMSATGAWFTDQQDTGAVDMEFGTITLGTVGAGSITFDQPDEREFDTDILMPGDTVSINFTLLNDGTAEMWTRFQLEVYVDSDGVGVNQPVLDTGVFVYTESTFGVTGAGVYTYSDGYYYRDARLAEDAQDVIAATFTIASDINPLVYEGATISMRLVVDAVQAANNGATNVVGNYV